MFTVYRVQDGDGRGPYKPGLTKYWADCDALSDHITETIMDLAGGLDKLQALPAGWHYGCACDSPMALAKWFTPTEAHRLYEMGYTPVSLAADKILFRSDKQMLIACKKPLARIAHPIGWQAIGL